MGSGVGPLPCLMARAAVDALIQKIRVASCFGGDLVVGNSSVGVQVRVLLGAVEPRQLDPFLEHGASPGVLNPNEVAVHKNFPELGQTVGSQFPTRSSPPSIRSKSGAGTSRGTGVTPGLSRTSSVCGVVVSAACEYPRQ
jgi:hypothetical protein